MFSKLKGNVDRRSEATNRASRTPGTGWSKPTPTKEQPVKGNGKGKTTSTSSSSSASTSSQGGSLFNKLDSFFDKEKGSKSSGKASSSSPNSGGGGGGSDGKKKMVEMSKDQLDRLQKELVALRTAKATLEAKVSAGASSLSASSGSGSKKKDLLSGMKMFGRNKSKQDVEAEIAQATAGLQAELAAERRALKELRSEVTLHKETKDQLVHSLQDLQADLDDQRQSFKTSQAALSEKNASLQTTIDSQSAQIKRLTAAAAAATAKEAKKSSTSSISPLGSDGGEPASAAPAAAAEAAPTTDSSAAATTSTSAAEVAAAVDHAVAEAALAQSQATAELEESLRTMTEESGIKRLKLERAEKAAAEQAMEIEGLRSQLQKASDAASAAGRARQQAEWSLEEVEDKLRNRDATVLGLEEEVAALSKECAALEEKCGTATAKAEDTQTILDEMLVKCTKVEEEAAQLTKTNKWYEGELEASNKALALAGKKSNDTETDLTKANDKLTADFAKQKAKLTAEIDTMKRTVSTAASKLTDEMSAKKAAEADVTRVEKLLEASQASDAESRADGVQLEKKLAEATAKLADVQNVQEALEASEMALKTSEQESTMMAEASERAVESGNHTATKLAEAEGANKKLSAEVEEMIERLAAETTSAESVSAQLAEAEAALATKTQALAELESARDALLAKTGTLTAECETATAALKAAEVQATLKAAEVTAVSERATAEVSRLERALQDSEAQRKLDQKKSTKSIRDLSKQLQRLESGGGGGGGGSGGSGSKGWAGNRSPSPVGPASSNTGNLTSPASASSLPVRTTSSGAANSGGESAFVTPSRPMPASRRSVVANGNASPMTSQQAISRSRGSPQKHGGGAHGVPWYKDRLQFYESHTEELTTDLKQKSKIIQMYLMRERTGKLGPKRPDLTKAMPTPAPGMMGRMLGSAPKQINGMTLELAVEMTTRLQQVTEDTLMKNIQLQESLEMLSQQLVPAGSGK